MEKKIQPYQLYTDGGARGNPGPAAIGAILYFDNDIFFEISEYIGRATNNQAEYQALIIGLEEAIRKGIANLECFLDSNLLVNQVNGLWRVKEPGLGQLFLKVWKLKQQFRSIRFSHIPREKNTHADRLVNQALDEAEEVDKRLKNK